MVFSSYCCLSHTVAHCMLTVDNISRKCFSFRRKKKWNKIKKIVEHFLMDATLWEINFFVFHSFIFFFYSYYQIRERVKEKMKNCEQKRLRGQQSGLPKFLCNTHSFTFLRIKRNTSQWIMLSTGTKQNSFFKEFFLS